MADEFLDSLERARREQASANVALAADANPDEAARAFQLESFSGVPAPVIAGNLKEFDSGFKARSSQQLVGMSEQLQKYIAANPLHAQISNDDYPNMVAISDAINDENAVIGGFSYQPGAPRTKFLENTADVYKELWTSLSEGPKQYKDIAETTKQFLLKQGYSEEQATREAEHIGDQAYRGEALQNLLWAVPTALAGPAIGAYRAFVTKPLEEVGGPPANVTETFTMAALATLGMRHMVRPEVAALADKIEPYLKEGKVPPTGIDPIVDQVKAEQAPVDLENLHRLEGLAQASATRERNPDIFANFLRQHEGMENASIGIPADAIAALYAGKLPAEGDNLLGFVPGLTERLQVALATGADVQVPLADWLAKVDPAVSKQLEQWIRVRPDGVTIAEIVEAKARPPIEQGPSEGFARFYHGGPPEGGELPTTGGGRWVTQDLTYAKNYRSVEGRPGQVWYVDVPEKWLEQAGINKSFDDTGTNVKAPYVHFEMPEEWARQMRPIEVLDQAGEAVQSVREAAKLGPILEVTPEGVTKPEWMTVAQFNIYQKLIAQRRAQDIEKATARNAARIAERESPTWRQHEAEIRTEVTEDMRTSGAFAADEFFRDGRLYGKDVERVRIGEEFLNDEQKAALPPSFVTKTGADPASVASLFGFGSGDELVFALAQLHAERVASGKNAPAYRRAYIDAETARRMEERYGDFSAKVLEEAREQALSEVQMDILHNDVHALAMAIGKQFLHEDGRPVTRNSFISAVREMWDRSKVGDYTQDNLLRTAGEAGRRVEDALLHKKFDEAFRQRQRQYIAVQMAKEAAAFEKAKGKFEKLAERYAQPVLKGTEQAYTNFIHDLLNQTGFKVKMTPDQIQRAISFEGYGLDAFVAERMSFGEELAVPSNYTPKPAEQMTVGEYQELMSAIRSLDKAGRDSKKIEVAGIKQDREAFYSEVKGNLEQRPVRDPEQIKEGGSWLYRLDAPATRAEEIVKDLDLRKELGPIYNAVIRPYELSKAKEYDLLDGLSKDLGKLKGKYDKGWRRKLHDPIQQDFIHDTWYNAPFALDRWGMIKMMLNWGNESNANKLAEGITRAKLGPADKATPDMITATKAKIQDLFNRNATKEDWDFVQHIFDIFKGWEKDIDTLTYNLSGETVKLLEPREIATPHGQYAGGYMPLIPDKQRPLQGKVMVEKEPPAGSGPLKKGYFRSTTNQSHLVERTGAKYFVDISSGPEQLIGRMQQIIHDLAYRDFAVNAGKVLYDPKIRHLVEKHYGAEYQKALDGWFERVVNSTNADEKALQGWNSLAKRVGDNLIFAALPLNYTVMFSPSLGAFNPVSFLKFHANHKANMDFVMKNSKELPHVLYSLDRDMTIALNKLAGDGRWSSFQRESAEKLMKPLTWMEQQFRAVTFMDEFQKQKGLGRSDAEASVLADSAVRERHSVAAIGDLSALRAHPNQFMRLATLFMGYFESQRNWLRQAPEQVRQGDYSALSRTLYGTVGIAAAYNLALFTKWKQNDSWFSYMARAVGSIPLQMVPFVKDVWGYVSEGFTPKNPIVNAGIALADLGKDGWDWFIKGKRPKSAVRHAFNVAGQLGGVPGAVQIGRTAQGLEGLRSGQEPPPRSIVEWMRLVWQGHTKAPKK